MLAYSGDTEATAPLDKLVEGADVAIVEATGPGDVFSHMSWEAANRAEGATPEDALHVQPPVFGHSGWGC